MTIADLHPRFFVLDDRRAAEPTVEILFASDEAAAIERILDDVEDVAGDRAADIVLAPLRRGLSDAFVTGDERAWRTVYALFAAVVDNATDVFTPALGRLRAFLDENADLALPFHRE
jgi:hypothetical protein